MVVFVSVRSIYLCKIFRNLWSDFEIMSKQCVGRHLARSINIQNDKFKKVSHPIDAV